MTIKTPTDTLTKRLRPLYIAGFLQGFVLWYAIEKLFMTSIGFNSQTIAIETIIFTVVMLISNIPMGVLADRWSRKGVLMLATGFLVANSIVSGSSHGFWMYTIGICLWGVYYAAYLGCYDSIVYDIVLEETNSSDKFEHYYGRIQLFESLALIASSLLSGIVVHFSTMRMTYFLTVPLALASLPALYVFKEPLIHKKELTDHILIHLKETLSAVTKRGQIFWIVLCLICLTVSMRIVFEFDQLWLIALAVPAVLFGPINAFLLTATGSSGLVAKLIKKKHASVMASGVLVVLASFVMLTHSIYMIILAQMILLAGILILNIIVGRYLHDTMPSNIRAGASSVVTTLGYLCFLPIAYLFGHISQNYSIFQAAWVLIAMTVAIMITLTIILGFRKNK